MGYNQRINFKKETMLEIEKRRLMRICGPLFVIASGFVGLTYLDSISNQGKINEAAIDEMNNRHSVNMQAWYDENPVQPEVPASLAPTPEIDTQQ